MKKANILVVFGIALAIVLSVAAVSYSAQGPSNNTAGSGSGTWQDTAVVPLSMNSQLSLDGQVDRNAPSGVVILQMSEDTDAVNFQVWVANIAPPDEVTIDLGSGTAVQLYPAGVGPIDDASGTFTGLLAMGTFISSDLIGPMQGQSISDFVSALKDGRMSITAQTASVPDGVISGQIDASTIWENAKLVPMLPVQKLTPNLFSQFLDRVGLDSPLTNPAVTDAVLSNLVGKDIGSILWNIPWGGAMISNENGALHYGVWAFNVASETKVTLNYGDAKLEGPSVASLCSGAGPAADGVVRGMVAEGYLAESDLVGPLQGHGISDLVKAIDSGNIFITLDPAQSNVKALKAQPYSLAEVA